MAIKPTVPEAMPFIQAIWSRLGSAVGCCLHIVIEDGNVEDRSVRFCIDEAKEHGHTDCLAAAELLLRMSRTQRRKIAATPHNYATGQPMYRKRGTNA